MADNKPKYKKPNYTKQEAESAIMKMQDLVMKVAQYYGLHNYGIAECIKNFGELKNSLQYKVEDSFNYPQVDNSGKPAGKKADGTAIVKLNLKSDKKYSF